jgi:AbrB family looped-hinge helix DNA binding protein
MMNARSNDRNRDHMTTATVGRRYQVVIPKAERQRLGLRPLSKVNVEAQGNCLILHPLTTAGVRGLGRELADAMDATDYVRQLRAEWGQRP